MTRATYSATPLLRSLVHRPQGVILVYVLVSVRLPDFAGVREQYCIGNHRRLLNVDVTLFSAKNFNSLLRPVTNWISPDI